MNSILCHLTSGCGKGKYTMNKSFCKVIDSVIVFNCKILNLEQPTVKYEPSDKFATPTTKAGINPDKNIIAININTVWENPVEIWWVISHELRHLWQVKNGQFNVDNYNPSQENNLKSYAMQFEEVDANAWGVYVIISLFRTRPLLENIYGEQVWQQILQRVEEIKAEYK